VIAPTPENLERARCQLRLDADGELRGDVEDIAAALDAAELRGFDRAVNETAIASIHKAVAAERAAIVRWLRDQDWGDASVAIEAGDHHPKETPDAV
jgi:hypothetical protein